MKTGFTLIEAMIVCAIIGILLAIFIPACEKVHADKQAQHASEPSSGE